MGLSSPLTQARPKRMPRRRNLWVTDTFERRLEAQEAQTTGKRYAVREDLLPVGHMSASDTANRISKIASPLAPGQETCLHECVIRRILAIVGSAIFLVLASGFLAGMVPWWISNWRVQAALLGLPTL